MNTTTSSTGGTITFTATGLIHTENINRNVNNDDSLTEKPVYDFSQFPTVIPSNPITGKIIRF